MERKKQQNRAQNYLQETLQNNPKPMFQILYDKLVEYISTEEAELLEQNQTLFVELGKVIKDNQSSAMDCKRGISRVMNQSDKTQLLDLIILRAIINHFIETQNVPVVSEGQDQIREVLANPLFHAMSFLQQMTTTNDSACSVYACIMEMLLYFSRGKQQLFGDKMTFENFKNGHINGIIAEMITARFATQVISCADDNLIQSIVDIIEAAMMIRHVEDICRS